MYSGYSLIGANETCKQKSISVLHKLFQINGPQLVTSLIKPLISLINSSSNTISTVNEESIKCLEDDKDVLWIMEVICYGLSLPLSDNEQIDAVRDCVNIYYEWFHSLSPKLSVNKFIPLPIRQDPNIYCQKIIGHFYNIFLPRTFNNNDNINDLISRQALFCHRILRLIITVASDKDNVIDGATWECLLTFLLAINEELLKSLVETNDIGTQIAERVICTLFQGWLLACVKHFPSPSLWKTLQNICIKLRHRPALIIQWNSINICLTVRLVQSIYKTGGDALNLSNKMNYSQYNEIVSLLNEDSLKQCWYHFLHIIGNPIELCFPEIIFKMVGNNQQIDAAINLLPFIFHKAIKGLCILVDIFLGIPNINLEDLDSEMPKFQIINSSINETPPEKRKSNYIKSNSSKSEKHHPQHGHKNHLYRNSKTFTEQSSYGLPTIVLPSLKETLFYQSKTKLSSILDIFGKWLFQASLICSPNNAVNLVFEQIITNCETTQPGLFRRSLSRSSTNEKISDDLAHFSLPLDNFEAGQAEAIGALCRIFCFKKSDDDISLVLSKQTHPDFQKIKNYLTSYYLALKFGLSSTNEYSKNQLLSSILVNCVWFFEADLPGSKILIPHFIRSIEIFLTKKEKSNSSNDILIRRACIRILISLLSYPLHYKDLAIKDTLSELPSNTFFSLFPRFILNLIYGLYNEPDSMNVQMVLGALLFIIEDSVNYDQLFLNDNLNDGPNQDLVVNLLRLFKIDYHNYFEPCNEFGKSEITCNLFLIIISFVAEILCKTSDKSSHKNSYDYNVSLTALEVLSALGRINYNDQLLCNNKCKLCIKQICTFIENQCYRPAMYHSKDMHSTIVAAYQCLSIWVNGHCHLLKDKECILLLFELIELGISGSKSRKEIVTVKSEKMLKPTSMRVREAAEFLLITLMGCLDINFSYLHDSTILSCDVNESKIISMLNLKSTDNPTKHFRYFLTENLLLIAILEQSPVNEETVCIIRSPYGKYCWLFKYQHLSSRHILNFPNEVSIYRSLSKLDLNTKNVVFNYFPNFYDKICTSKFDNMVLKLPNYINELNELKQDFQMMENIIDKIENNLKFEKNKLTINTNKKDFNEPLTSKTFEPSRLILSQFKVFNFDIQNTLEGTQNLVAINNNSQDFIDQLAKLDMISTKNNDIVMVFYIPKGFQNENEIFDANLHQSNSAFKYFLNTIGHPVESSEIFYWGDISHELIFVCPSKHSKPLQQLSMSDLIKKDNETLRAKFFEANKNASNDNIKSYLLNNVGSDIKLFVLWLECIEDFDKLPFKTILSNSSENKTESEKLYVIAIIPLKNGLFKVFPHSFGAKTSPVSPIIDRMLLSKHLLIPYVRITALNLFRRRRMNAESFQLPHVKRRIKIQEILNKFKLPHTNKELISDLFHSNLHR